MHPRLWIYNYDFELELAGRDSIILEQRYLSPWYFLNRSSFLFLPLIGPSDIILTHGTPDSHFLKQYSSWLGFQPKFVEHGIRAGETNSALDDLSKNPALITSFKDHIPEFWGIGTKSVELYRTLEIESFDPGFLERIRYANSKKFSDDIRNQLLPLKCRILSKQILNTCTSLNEIKNQISRFQKQHSAIIVKHFFGTSGQLSDNIGITPATNRQLSRWKSWISQSGGILLEKFETVQKEYSIQAEITEDGKIKPIVMTRMLANRNGSYLGNLFYSDMDRLFEINFDLFLPAFKRLAEVGYKGPVGLDLFDSGNGELKLLEINSRYTMGRIAYEWNKLLNHHDVGVFVNLFFGNGTGPGTNDQFYQGLKSELKNNCSLFVLNHIKSNQTGNSLLTALIGAPSAPAIQDILEKIKPKQFQNFTI